MSTVLSAAAVAALLANSVALPPHQRGARLDPWKDIQGFNVVLVVGDAQGGSTSPVDLPAAAKRALDDMRDFLPYKSYRVLDTQWTSCCTSEVVQTGLPIAGRLQGVVGIPGSPAQGGTLNLVTRPYAYLITVSRGSDNRIGVRFVLRLDDGGSRSAHGAEAESEARLAQLKAEMDALKRQIERVQQQVKVGLAPASALQDALQRYGELERHYAQAQVPAAATSRSIIDSSFTMDVGETVVVGTSRLGGDKALIALVTAARRR